MPTEIFKLAGATIDRAAAQIVIVKVTPHIRGGIPELLLARRGIKLAAPPDIYANDAVEYWLDAVLIFAGNVTSQYDHNDEHLGWVREYRCLGLLQRAQYVANTDSATLTDTSRYNLAPDDIDEIPARQGRTAGQVALDVLTMVANATALDAAGIGAYTTLGPPPVLPAATLADLAALSVIPQYEVDLSGERILQNLEGVIQGPHPNHYLHVEPDGTIRFLDPRTFTPVTLTIGTDPRVGLPEYTRDWCGCYTRVLVRGNTRVRSFTPQTRPWPGSVNADGGLVEDFGHDGLTNAQAKALWVAGDFQRPDQPWGEAVAFGTISGGGVTPGVSQGGYGYGTTAPGVHISGDGTGASAVAVLTSGSVSGFTSVVHGTGYTHVVILIDPPGGATYDIGTCTCPSTTTVTVTSDNPRVHWGSDYWDQTAGHALGIVILYADIITGVQQFWQARVVANTALTAGGTSTLTIDNPLPSLNYNAYQIIGVGTGASVVWRKYKLTDTATGAALRNYFPYPVAYRSPDGLAATTTTAITGTVMLSEDGSGNPPYYYRPEPITVDPSSGHVYFTKPTALVYSIDGKTPVPPDNVQCFLAVQDGTLQQVYPPDSGGFPVYGGTAFTVEGIQRTKTITVPDWRDYGNNASMLTYATEMFDSLSNTVVEGTLPYYGYDPQWLAPGLSLNIAAPYVTGLESVNVPVVQVDLIPDEHAEEGTSYTTLLHFSNRRAPYSAAALLRPNQTGMGGLLNLAGSVNLAGGLGGAAGQFGAELNTLQTQVGDVLDQGAAAKASAAAMNTPMGTVAGAMGAAESATTPEMSGVDLGGQDQAAATKKADARQAAATQKADAHDEDAARRLQAHEDAPAKREARERAIDALLDGAP